MRTGGQVLLEVVQAGQAGLVLLGETVQLARGAGGEGQQVVQVHADDVIGVDQAQLAGDSRTPVPALGAVTLVAQPAHQGGPCLRDPAQVPARLGHRAGQTYTVPTAARGPTVDAAVLTAVAAACRDRHRLRFDYRGHDGTRSVRAAEPHRLVHTAAFVSRGVDTALMRYRARVTVHAPAREIAGWLPGAVG